MLVFVGDCIGSKPSRESVNGTFFESDVLVVVVDWPVAKEVESAESGAIVEVSVVLSWLV